MKEDLLKAYANSINDDGNGLISVSLTDKINIGCNYCGDCCINSQTRLNSLDVYNMLQKISIKELMEHTEPYFERVIGLPSLTISNKKSGMCSFLQNVNGDFKCSLKEYKPLICNYQFVGIGTAFEEKNLSFVEFGQDVPKVNVEDIINRDDYKDNIIFFKERCSRCKAPKHDVSVEEYIKKRKDLYKEYNLANYINIFGMRYIDFRKFIALLELSERSKVNFLSTEDQKEGEIKKSEKMRFVIMSGTLLYPDPDKDFLEQSINQFNRLQDIIFPTLRELYESLLYIFDGHDGSFDEIYEIYKEDQEKAQIKFDNNYLKNLHLIASRVYERMPKLKGMEDIKF